MQVDNKASLVGVTHAHGLGWSQSSGDAGGSGTWPSPDRMGAGRRQSEQVSPTLLGLQENTVDIHTLFWGRAMVGLMEREKKYEKEIKGLHVRSVCSARSHPWDSPTYFHEIHTWQILSGNFLEY